MSCYFLTVVFFLFASSLIKIHLFRPHKIRFVLKTRSKIQLRVKILTETFHAQEQKSSQGICVTKARSNQMKSVNLKIW